MATPTVVTHGAVLATSASPLSILVGVGVQTGDVIVAGQFSDFYQLSYFLTPSSANVSTWSSNTGISSNPGSDNAMLGKLWWGTFTAGGAQSITFSTSPDEGSYITYVVLRGSGLTITATATGQANNTASTSHVCAEVDPVTADARLINMLVAGANGTTNYTAPGSMTELTEGDFSPSTVTGGDEVLASAAATGTRTWTSSGSRRYAALTFAAELVSSGLDATGTASSGAETAATTRIARHVSASAEAGTIATAAPRATRHPAAEASAGATATATTRVTVHTAGTATAGTTATAVPAGTASATGAASVGTIATALTRVALHAAGTATAGTTASAAPRATLHATAAGTVGATVGGSAAVGGVRHTDGTATAGAGTTAATRLAVHAAGAGETGATTAGTGRLTLHVDGAASAGTGTTGLADASGAADLNSAGRSLSGTQAFAYARVRAGAGSPVSGSSGWYTLAAVVAEAWEMLAEDQRRLLDPVECPNDGEPLSVGPGGVRYCRYDGFRV